jgi:thioredoxin reductase
VNENLLDPQFREGRTLAADAARAGASFVTEASVWGAFTPLTISAITPACKVTVRPKRLIIASGAYDRGVPIPGWTLPGVITTGAAQTLLRSYQVSPGKRVLIAGNGPLNLQVARELTDVGVDVVALVEASRAPGLRTLGALARMTIEAPSLVRTGVAHMSSLRRSGVPIIHGHALVRVEGHGRAERAVVGRIDESGRMMEATERDFAVDAVCMGYGFLPQVELARALGCHHSFDSTRGSLIVDRDEDGRTDVRDVFVVGDAGGIAGARVAIAQGQLAAHSVIRDLAPSASAHSRADVSAVRSELRRYQRFQEALWALYRAPVITHQLATPDTIMCRCENVEKQAIASLTNVECESLGTMKRRCRAGMGACQGRYCGTVLAEMVRQRLDTQLSDLDFFAPRPPVRPVTIASIADTREE